MRDTFTAAARWIVYKREDTGSVVCVVFQNACAWLQDDFESGARPTNDISIEFEIRPKFGVL